MKLRTFCRAGAHRASAATPAWRVLSLLLALMCLVALLAACDTTPEEPEHVDYVASTKLDMNSDTKKITATVKVNIDGDTTHFYVDRSDDFSDGLVKVRYLAIDTPESTGKLEEWGKTAAKFTKETLASATEILLESDTSSWNKDNNGRHLMWVWYKTAENADWRCLNIEILQSGLAVGSNAGGNRYGSTCLSALAQAKREKLYVHSDELDPSFPYDAATAVSIKELHLNPEEYEGVKVAVEGVIAQGGDGTLYFEEYDDEDGRSYGMQVFYGYGLSTSAKRFLKAGNRVCIVGSFQYSEVVNSYQIAGLEYNSMKPGDPANTHLLEENVGAPSTEITDVADFINGTVDFTVGEGNEATTVTLKNSTAAIYTGVSFSGLKVVSTYTTQNEKSDDYGAITLTCEKDGVRITVRTVPLFDENNKMITADAYEGQTIDVRGVWVSYTPEGSTTANEQVKIFHRDAIIIH